MPVKIIDRRRKVSPIVDAKGRHFGHRDKPTLFDAQGKKINGPREPRVILDRHGKPLKQRIIIPLESEIAKETGRGKATLLTRDPVLRDAQNTLKALKEVPLGRAADAIHLVAKSKLGRKRILESDTWSAMRVHAREHGYSVDKVRKLFTDMMIAEAKERQDALEKHNKTLAKGGRRIKNQ